MNLRQLRDYVVRPTLQYTGLHSDAAEILTLGTAWHESGGLQYIAQVGGPARGLWQMEPATHDDIWANYLFYQPTLAAKIRALGYGVDALYGNLPYACAMCRVHYRRVKAPLPAATDLHGLAEYAKRHYNTPQGRATVEQYLEGMRKANSG